MTENGNKLHIRASLSPQNVGCTTLLTAVPEDAWQAIVPRDRATESRFVFGVETTRIFCRSSCLACRPAREKVWIFGAAGEARSALREAQAKELDV